MRARDKEMKTFHKR